MITSSTYSASIKEDIKITAKLNSTEFVIGSNVLINILVANNTKKIIIVEMSRLFRDYKLEVTSANGQKVGLTVRGKANLASSGEIFKRSRKRLQPGQEIKDQIELSENWDLSKKGEYQIKLKRLIFSQGGKIGSWVDANSINFRITEK